MPPTTPEGPEFQEAPADVNIYLGYLRLAYQSPTESQRLVVVAATLCKQKSLSNHEYVSITVETAQKEQYYFAIERMPHSHITPVDSASDISLPIAEAQTQPEPSPIPPPRSPSNLFSRSSSSISIASLKECQALDQITWMATDLKEPSDQRLDILRFPQKNVYLYHFVTLAATIHRHHDLYQLFSRNCYFLAGMIMHIMAVTYGGLEEVVPQGKGRQKGSGKGTWWHLGRTFELPKLEDAVQTIRATWEGGVKKFEDGVSDLNMLIDDV